jgi:hypothetical protein
MARQPSPRIQTGNHEEKLKQINEGILPKRFTISKFSERGENDR